VYGTLSGAGKHFVNRTFGSIATSNKTARTAVLGVSVDGRDNVGGGGLNGFSIAATRGKLDLSGLPSDLSSDDITARANGVYSKTNYSLSRLQRLGSTTSLYASISGQRALKNLDSSEQFSLGGPTGVRAYPTGEAIGDEGVLGTLEGRWQFAENWQAAIFTDRGRISLHRNVWDSLIAAAPEFRNTYFLGGAGIDLTYSRPGNFTVRVLAATKIGINPGRNAEGNDADNKNARTHAWIQVIKFL
jgi:hemolysin activation/secretion protein